MSNLGDIRHLHYGAINRNNGGKIWLESAAMLQAKKWGDTIVYMWKSWPVNPEARIPVATEGVLDFTRNWTMSNRLQNNDDDDDDDDDVFSPLIPIREIW